LSNLRFLGSPAASATLVREADNLTDRQLQLAELSRLAAPVLLPAEEQVFGHFFQLVGVYVRNGLKAGPGEVCDGRGATSPASSAIATSLVK
jgi:hypothetical protein